METSARNRAERRLAAILAAGYSRLIGADEEGTLSRIRSIRADIIDPAIGRYSAPNCRARRDPSPIFSGPLTLT
jgi:hypothetical protein